MILGSVNDTVFNCEPDVWKILFHFISFIPHIKTPAIANFGTQGRIQGGGHRDYDPPPKPIAVKIVCMFFKEYIGFFSKSDSHDPSQTVIEGRKWCVSVTIVVKSTNKQRKVIS